MHDDTSNTPREIAADAHDTDANNVPRMAEPKTRKKRTSPRVSAAGGMREDGDKRPRKARRAEAAGGSEKGKAARKGASRKSAYPLSELSQDIIDQLDGVASKVSAIGKKTTAITFEIGDLLMIAAEIVPPKTFGKWVSQKCEISPRHGRNYVAVAENLSAFRDRLIDQRVAPSAMFRLASADVEKIEKVVSTFESGKRLRIREVVALIGKVADATPEGETANLDGPASLKAIMAQKVKKGLPLLIEHLSSILDDVREALQRHHAGKRVIKDALGQKVELAARLAKGELESLASFAEVRPRSDDRVIQTAELPNEGWRATCKVLNRLGGYGYWPDADKLGEWLVTEVVPALEWSLGPKATKKPEAAAAAADEFPDNRKPKAAKAAKVPKVGKPRVLKAKANFAVGQAATNPASDKVETEPAVIIPTDELIEVTESSQAASLPTDSAPEATASRDDTAGVAARAPSKRSAHRPGGSQVRVRELKASLIDAPVTEEPAAKPRGFQPPSFMKHWLTEDGPIRKNT